MPGSVPLLGICTNTTLLGVEVLKYFPTSCLVAVALSLSLPLTTPTVLIPEKPYKQCPETILEPTKLSTLVLGPMTFLPLCQGGLDPSKEDVTLGGGTMAS